MAHTDHQQDIRNAQSNSFPPSGPLNLPAHPIDRFTDNFIKFLDNMPSRTLCESAVAADLHGFHIPPCSSVPTVCDLDSELEFCWPCYRMYRRGDWDAR